MKDNVTEVWLASAARPGRGAWAWASTANGHGEGVEDGAATWRMDLVAAVQALRATPGPVRVIASSAIIDVGTTWLDGWRAKGWQKKGGIADLDVVQALALAIEGRKVEWLRVPSEDVRVDAVKARARAALDGAGPIEVKRPEVAPTRATVLVYTDGGCRGNPGGIGGWGALMIHVPSDKARTLRGGVPDTTNNRMEMLGAISALMAFSADRQDVEIRSDSKYLVDMASKWLPGWKKRGWKRGGPDGGGEIKNLELVKQLDGLIAKHRVKWTWVRGHAGEPGNELVDALTNAAMDDVKAGKNGRADERFDPSPVRVRPQ